MAGANVQILVVDDEAEVRALLRKCFEREGFQVVEAKDGAELRARIEQHPISLITLDLTLGGEDGLELAREIRAKCNVPIVMISGKGDTIDRVVGLELGADDYIAKPFGPRELVARLRAVLRRVNPTAETELVVVNEISIDVPAHKVKVDGREIELTGIEFDVLLALARRAGRVVARDALLSEAGRGDVTVSDRTVDVHISHLRQKLNDDPRSPKKIKTIRGVGYVLVKDRL
jgi:DNA-binding response OmpR family regulator